MTFAASTTVLRVTLRIRNFSGDDALAILALISLIITAVTGKMYYAIDDFSTMPQSSRVALYYISTVTFNTTVWLSRLSILATIIRLGSFRKQLYTAAGCFTAALLILVAQVFWVCEPQNSHNHWKTNPVPQCVLGMSVAITQVTTDAFADATLVVFPLLMLRYIQSEQARAQKVRLGVSFIVGGLTTIVSIVHAVYLLRGTHMSILISNIELSVSVTISNFAVLVAAAHRLWNNSYLGHETWITELSTVSFGSPPPSVSTLGRTGGSNHRLSGTSIASTVPKKDRRDKEISSDPNSMSSSG
ncbi:hypothetical protein BDP27DRAFT_1424780 [Rhodocollybia butyracea]|uniref:Rhodopsin domain-containing protein n=1 Tax=Rhodocollybia butyracea TaxID=206335 RepID=A0A9P5U4A6_9AGAR|nr:hypothetical protein BDP27DRAFT_1424780 [Rhodocollybia butyracea]